MCLYQHGNQGRYGQHRRTILKLPRKYLNIFYRGEYHHLSEEDVKAIKSLMDYPAIQYLFRNVDLDNESSTDLVAFVNMWDELGIAPDLRFQMIQDMLLEYDFNDNRSNLVDSSYAALKEEWPDLKYCEVLLALEQIEHERKNT